MAPSGQPGILALLQQSKDRLRGEQEDRLRGEQGNRLRGEQGDRLRGEQEVRQKGEHQVMRARKRKLQRREQSSSTHVKVVKKVKRSDQGAEELTKGLVFNYMNGVVPSLAQEYESSFDVTRNSLHLCQVLGLTRAATAEHQSPNSKESMVKYRTVSTEDLVKSLVLRYLRKEAAGLVKEFTERFDPGETRLELEEVLRGFQGGKQARSIVPRNSHNQWTATNVSKSSRAPGAPKKNGKIGTRHRGYMEQEDAVIRAAMEEAGEGAIDCRAIAEQLNRKAGSVASRVYILNREGKKEMKAFTLEEDMILLEELIVPRLKLEKLSDFKLKLPHCAELTARIQKGRTGVLQHWERILQPLLLQHYTGTLHLRVELMLANFIQDNFTEFLDIEWSRVAVIKEFAGNTESSLRQLYLGRLKNNTTRKFRLDIKDVTIGHITEYCRQVYGQGKGRMGTNKELKQQKIIQFFEKKMEELQITDFI